MQVGGVMTPTGDIDVTHIHTGGIMSESKSGYEIRADLLSQAQALLQDNRHAITDRYHNMVCRAQEQKDVPWPEYPTELQTPMTAQDVITVAKQFNDFVNSK